MVRGRGGKGTMGKGSEIKEISHSSTYGVGIWEIISMGHARNGWDMESGLYFCSEICQ